MKISNLFIIPILIVTLNIIGCPSDPKALRSNGPVLIQGKLVDSSIEGTRLYVELEFKMKNLSSGHITIAKLGHGFVHFYGLDPIYETPLPVLDQKEMMRSDGRTTKGDFITLAPNEEKLHALRYRIQLRTARRVSAKFIYDREAEDNWYYDFKNEGIHAKTRIKIDALTGHFESNKINILE